MRVTTIHSTVALWVARVFVAVRAARRRRFLLALSSLINQDRYGSHVALCADTGEPPVQQGAEKNPRHCRVGRRGRESPAHSCRTGCVRSLLVAGRAASGRHCRGRACGYFPPTRPRRLCASNRGRRSARSSSTIARFRARAGLLTGYCSGWSSPTVARHGWKCSRPIAAGSSIPLRPSTTPSPGPPRAS